MTTKSSPPPSSEGDEPVREAETRSPERPSARPDEGEELRGGFERILPELLRRGLSAGRERVGETIFSKELAGTLISHMGDLRSGVVKAVAHEVGRFLREADIASEIRKVLAGLDVEAQVRLRFTERKDGKLEPKLDVEVDLPKRPPPPERPKREP